VTIASFCRAGGAIDDFWPNVALKTQAVVDAVMQVTCDDAVDGNHVQVQICVAPPSAAGISSLIPPDPHQSLLADGKAVNVVQIV